MRRILYFLPLLLFLVIVLFLSKSLEHDPHKLPSALIDQPMPDLGAPLTPDIFKGQVSLLNVWGTWCPTCEAEHAVLLDIANSHDVTLYGLNYRDQPSDARRWIAQHGNPYRAIMYDPEGLSTIELGVYGAPETFVIDKKGVIRYKHIGAVSPAVWEEILKPLIEKLDRE